MRKKLGVFTNKLVRFLVNFREYILKIALNRSTFSPKCTKEIGRGRRWEEDEGKEWNER